MSNDIIPPESNDGFDDDVDDDEDDDDENDEIKECEKNIKFGENDEESVAVNDLSMTKPVKEVVNSFAGNSFAGNGFASKGSKKWIDTSAIEKSMSELDQHNKSINMYRIQMLMNKQLREGHDLSQILDNESDTPIVTRPASPMQSTPNFMAPLYSSSVLTSAAKSTSAVSLLVEAALNSVANCNENSKEMKSVYGLDQSSVNLYSHSQDNDAQMCSNKNYSNIDMDEEEEKILKAQQHFPALNLTSDGSMPLIKDTDKRLDSEIDVDSGSQHEPDDFLGADNMHHHDGQLHKTGIIHMEESPQSPSPVLNYNPNVEPRNGRMSNEDDLECSAASPTLNLYNNNYDTGSLFRKRIDMSDRAKKPFGMASSSDEENSMLPQNLNIPNHGMDDGRMKLNYSKYNVNGSVGSVNNFLDVKSKYLEHNFESNFIRGFSGNVTDALNETQGLDMSSRNNVEFQNNLYLGQNNSGASTNHLGGVGNRYHHHIYDILSDRDAQHMDMPMTHHQSQMLDHGIHGDAINQEQIATVDLSRSTTNYHQQNSSSFSYSHSCSDILRSNDSASNCPSGSSSVNNSSSFLLPQGQHGHGLRDGPSDYHRFAPGTDQHRFLVSNNIGIDHHTLPNASRLLLDTGSFVLDQNNRIINDEGNRQLSASRGFSPYQQANYQHSIHSVNPPNYHAFSPYF